MDKMIRITRTGAAVFVVVCVLGCLFFSRALQAAEHPWKLRVNKGGVEVYTRPVDGSATLEFKGSTIVDAPLSRVVSVFENVERMTAWFYQCTAARMVQREDHQQKVVYMILHLPWPVTERDCVFRISRSVDNTTKALDYTVVALPDSLPVDHARIRVPYLKGYWRFTPRTDGKTGIYFQQHSDPGGVIPAFISNSLVVNMPYHSLKGLRALVEGEKK